MSMRSWRANDGSYTHPLPRTLVTGGQEVPIVYKYKFADVDQRAPFNSCPTYIGRGMLGYI